MKLRVERLDVIAPVVSMFSLTASELGSGSVVASFRSLTLTVSISS